MSDLSFVKRLKLSDPRQGMVAVRTYLRELIYNNSLPAGMIISQVELAEALGVSRTPLREALRMLQEEGLIEAETNRRCRIAGFSPRDLDAAYSGRLLLEALTMRMTLPQLKAEDIDALYELLAKMESLEAAFEKGKHAGLVEWRDMHREFHFGLTSKAPPLLLEQLRTQVARCERYLISIVSSRPFGSIARKGEHRTLVDLIRNGQFDEAMKENARHRARSAILLLAEAACDFEPSAIRGALRMISADTGLLPGLAASEKEPARPRKPSKSGRAV